MKKYFITGLLVLVPLVITIWVLKSLIGVMDQSLLLLPEVWHPHTFLGRDIPGIGAILTVLIVLTTGLIATNFFGMQLILLWEKLLNRLPVVKSIYSSVKQVSDTLFSDSGNAFRKAVLVPFPREGVWTIAFVTGTPGGDVANHLHGDYVSVFVPTTPNPTGGYFLMMPKADVIELEMTVDEALKYIISMGVVAPANKIPKLLTQYPNN
ncbi:MAG: DUF502 domain-containing protein [Methylotenera sp.]|nr:DUF502 domain-containing protein [Methylotenera sp.]